MSSEVVARYTPLVFEPGVGGLLPEQVDAVRALVRNAEETTAEVGFGAGQHHDPTARSSALTWLALDESTRWLFSRVYTLAVRGAEQGGWRFELEGPQTRLQYTRYRASHDAHDGHDIHDGHYGWHVDVGAPTDPERKVSVAIQLSHGDEYEGGDLELLTGGEPWRAPRTSGVAMVFPSFVVHRVLPVTAGERHSLVAWVCGPPLR